MSLLVFIIRKEVVSQITLDVVDWNSKLQFGENIQLRQSFQRSSCDSPMAGNTFTKAFVMSRFVKDECKYTCLVSLLEQDQVCSIEYLKTHGIKKYFVNDFNENVDTDIIDDIFDIIVNTFSKEYNSIVSYKKSQYLNESNSKQFYKSLFKQSDLVFYIFQYLCNDDDELNLINCSLVDTVWLCHSFNPKCLQNLHPFAFCTIALSNQSIPKRGWNRLSQVDNIYLRSFDHNSSGKLYLSRPTESLINGIKHIQLANVKSLHISIIVDVNQPSMAKLYNELVNIVCCNQLEYPLMKQFYWEVTFKENDENDKNDENSETGNMIGKQAEKDCTRDENNRNVTLANICKINLTQCTRIEVAQLYQNNIENYDNIQLFKFKTSNNCKDLTLSGKCILDLVDQDWSGITHLALDGVSFLDCNPPENDKNDTSDKSDKIVQSSSINCINGERKIDSDTIIGLSKKCTSIEKVSLQNPTDDMLTFWRGINMYNYLEKNNGKLGLWLTNDEALQTDNQTTSTMIKTIKENDYIIDELALVNINDESCVDFIQESLFPIKSMNKSVEKLNICLNESQADIDFGAKLSSGEIDISDFTKLKMIVYMGGGYVPNLTTIVNLSARIGEINELRLQNNQRDLISFSTYNNAVFGFDAETMAANDELIEHVRQVAMERLDDQGRFGLYTQFDSFFSNLTGLIDMNVALFISVDLAIYIQAKEFNNLFNRVKKDYFEPFHEIFEQKVEDPQTNISSEHETEETVSHKQKTCTFDILINESVDNGISVVELRVRIATVSRRMFVRQPRIL